MARLAVARLYCCSNSFNPVRTRLRDVRADPSGAGALRQSAALAAFLAARPDWHASVLADSAAPSGGPLPAEAFAAWLAEVEARLGAGRFDAVYLSLHGACQAEGDPSADLTILRRVRARVGRLPVVASFSAAANLSEESVLLLDGASGGARAEARALGLLDRLVAGEVRPVGALIRLPSLLPSLGAPLLLAEIAETDIPRLGPGVLDASVFSGFPWADSPIAGASALAWTDRDGALARETAARLAELLQAAPRPPPLWQPAAALAAGRATGGRFALLDPSDDPSLGGMADTPGLLAALLGADLPGPAVFALLHDPAAVAAARAAGQGAVLERAFGARLTGDYGPPIVLRVTVERLAGAGDAEGTIAVLRHGGIAIVLSDQRPASVGLETLARAGIAVEAQMVVALKAGGGVDPVLAEAFPEVLACACPGPASPGLLGLPFQYVPASRRRA